MNSIIVVANRVILLSLVAMLTACGGSSSGGGGSNEVQLPLARGLLPDLAIHDGGFESDFHSGASQCSDCHSDETGDTMLIDVDSDVPGETRNVSIGTAWETSVMALATRDPYWHAVFASELDNFPMLEDTINKECTICHAPTAYDLADKQGMLDELRLFDTVDESTGEELQGLYTMDSGDELFNHAMDGVTCTLCHQMEDVNFGTEASFTGGYVINGSPSGIPGASDRPAYGQYGDPLVASMQSRAGFLPLLGTHLSTSESCATCHNLNIEPVTPAGEEIEGAGHFAEQAIYTEWEQSSFNAEGTSCQSCHMPVLDQTVRLANNAGEKRPDFAEHTFLGANTVMLDMFKNFAVELGIEEPGVAPTLDFDEAIVRNREFLRTSAQIAVVAGTPTADGLNFSVEVDNQTGHKLPAGYHSRRVYLHVEVLNASGETVFESGQIRDNGSIVGVDEDVNPSTYEPHYDVITEPTQVQVYQSVVGDINNDRTHSLLSGTQFLKDNRLLPNGLDKDAIANSDEFADSFGTFGNALTDENFAGGGDTVTYALSLPGTLSGDVFTVRAELRYQPLNYGSLQQLFTQGDRVDQVDMFRTIYENTELRDEFIDTDTLVIQ